MIKWMKGHGRNYWVGVVLNLVMMNALDYLDLNP